MRLLAGQLLHHPAWAWFIDQLLWLFERWRIPGLAFDCTPPGERKYPVDQN
jgi:hypothetical protein